jgi:hypothetical protein
MADFSFHLSQFTVEFASSPCCFLGRGGGWERGSKWPKKEPEEA